MSALLEMVGVRARYADGGTVLHGIDLRIEVGAIVALLGANGAGKTTTLRAITGAIATDGVIQFNGQRLRRNAPDFVARCGIAHVTEGRGILSAMTVWENLSLGGYRHRNKSKLTPLYERVVTYFPKLIQRRHQLAGTLSGGEQQMLAIGRALMMEPQLLLLDEPSTGIAPMLVREIFALLEAINRSEGVTILVAEQNVSLALQVANDAYVLETGRITQHEPAAYLRNDVAAQCSS